MNDGVSRRAVCLRDSHMCGSRVAIICVGVFLLCFCVVHMHAS